MLSRSLLVFLLLYASIAALSQSRDAVDELNDRLSRSRDDNERYEILLELSWELRAAYPDSAILYAQKALGIGKSKARKDIAKCFNYIGVANTHKGDNLAAYDFFKQALTFAEKNNDPLQVAHANNNIGKLFVEQGLLNKAYPHLEAAKEVFTKMNDLSGLAYTLQTIGGYHMLSREWQLAEENYLAALKIRNTLGNKNALVNSQLQLGKFYITAQQIDKAILAFQTADSISRTTNEVIANSEIKVNLGECLFLKGQLGEAERMAAEGLSMIERSKNIRLLPEAYLTMGQIQRRKGNITQAKAYFNKTLSVSTTRQDLNTRLEAYFLLWQTDSMQMGKSQSQVSNYRNFLALQDSIRTLEISLRESRFHFQLAIERKESENVLLKVRSERKTAVIAILIIFVISSLIIVFQLIRNRLKILRRNQALENHMNTLIDFSKNRSMSVGNLAHAAKDIVSITAKKLKISQVSIWVYDGSENNIQSIACYNLEQDKYLDSETLKYTDAPHYFEAIKKERVIVADDARTNAATFEFTESYFKPNDIFSLLDVTFFLDGQLKGLLCCEHQRKIRQWTAEDKLFISSVADIITLAFRTSQRLEYEKKIKDQNRKITHMNEVLEDRVKQRTEQLENQNKRLSEYAFINSHLLRAPLSRILGLLNLIDHDSVLKNSDLVTPLRKSGAELDEIVKKISAALNDGDLLSIDKLKEGEDKEK